MRRLLRGPALLGLVALLAAGCGGNGDAVATTAEPYKVTVAGDSISFGLGAAVREQVAARPNAQTKVIGVGGTGLARPDNVDWPGRLETLAKDFPPKVLLLSLGSNDAQDLTDESGRTVATFAPADTADGAAWDAEYSTRLSRTFDAFQDTGTTVLWVGHVRTGKDRVGLTNRRIHRLAVAAAADRPWVRTAD
ncbi:MAG: hypothetical protein ACKO04_00995, partial [Actinomycetes bacterium]